MSEDLNIRRRQRERGHLALSFSNDVGDFVLRQITELAVVDQRSRTVRAPCVVAMTKRADLDEGPRNFRLRGECRRGARRLRPGGVRGKTQQDRHGQHAYSEAARLGERSG